MKPLLSTLQFSQNSVLIHMYMIRFYVLPLECSEMDFVYPLQELEHKGHKASVETFQFSRDNAHYLGHDLTAEGTSLLPERIKTIQFSLAYNQKAIKRFTCTCGAVQILSPMFFPNGLPIGSAH